MIAFLRRVIAAFGSALGRRKPPAPPTARVALAEAPAFLGVVERMPSGKLVITSLASTDLLYRLGCQAGDVVLSIDGVLSQAVPDDLLGPGVRCSRVIVSRDGEQIGFPDREFTEHADPDVRAERIAELMNMAMLLLTSDPDRFLLMNRHAGPAPAAREGTTQPTILPAA